MSATSGTRLLAFLICLASLFSGTEPSLGKSAFTDVFANIRNRPQFTHSIFGVAIYSLDRKEMLYEWNGKTLFVPGSTTKLVTEGTALQLLGSDYRFHTPIYRTGQIRDGTLKGNLVLVASGDPNLSGRLEPSGSLAFANQDHVYGGYNAKLIGDPLAALKQLATQVAAAGIHKIDGKVLIDASLFPQGQRELGTHVALSPIIVNDNVIDITIFPGLAVGTSGTLVASPQPYYVRFVNEMMTGTPKSKLSFALISHELSDGSIDVKVRGSIPFGGGEYIGPYAVSNPSRFAAALLTTTLRERGIDVANEPYPTEPVGDQFKAFYTPDNKVAELISAPLSEDVKVTLKVSQNLHASTMPYILGAVLLRAKENVDRSGLELERNYLTSAGLDLSGASQSDGAGGNAFFSPDFMVHYLAYTATQSYFAVFKDALPVLGRDGSLYDIQTTSPAAGRVYAKTGTFDRIDLLNNNTLLSCRALAGYTKMKSGEHVAFAIYVNNVPLVAAPDDPVGVDSDVENVSQTLGELAAAINMLSLE